MLNPAFSDIEHFRTRVPTYILSWIILFLYQKIIPRNSTASDLVLPPFQNSLIEAKKWLSLAHPIMNFILPLLAAWMRMGTSWGSLGPNIPWGRIAVVKKLLSGSFALSTSLSKEKFGKIHVSNITQHYIATLEQMGYSLIILGRITIHPYLYIWSFLFFNLFLEKKRNPFSLLNT